ncbi:MAG: YvbH-like oligomerization domain-containing protein, partial [Romboutsia sp.]
FSFGNEAFSIDVDKKQLEQLKDLYKVLVEVGRIQGKNQISIEDGTNGLKMANDALSRCVIEGNIKNIVQDLTNFNLDWMEALRNNYNNKDFAEVFEKYINN